MPSDYTKPLPRPLNPELTRPFWEAAQRHELVMPRCTTCAHVFFYPRSECPRCFSSALEWVTVSGRGRLHSFTIVYQPANAAFKAEAPHVYAVIQLDEGPRLISNVVQCDPEAVRVDMPLVAVFDDVTPEWTLDVHFINTLPVLVTSCHSRESGNPGDKRHGNWMPAYAGMTFYWHRTYETDI